MVMSPLGTVNPGSGYWYPSQKPMLSPAPTPMQTLPTAQDPFDSFESVAAAIIKPTDKQSYQVEGRVSPTGQIFQKGLNGIQVLGQIDTQGNYRLINGMAGNAFQDERVIVGGYQEQQSPFAQALKASQRQRAVTGSEIPLLRKNLTALGLNGQGITVGILDPQEKDKKTSQWQASNHTKTVIQVINDPVWGAAPRAQVVDLGGQWEMCADFPSDNYQVFVNTLTGDYTRQFTELGKGIQTAMQKRDPSLRVLNVTSGLSRTKKYVDVWQKLNAMDDNGYYKFPAIRSAVLGPAITGSYKQQFAAAVRTVDSVLDNSPVVQQAWQQYVETTRQAAQAGMIIVQSAANENNTLPFEVPLKPGSGMNDCAKSPYVITVAAASTNQQPGNRAAYVIAPFSSRGDGLVYNPTIAAPGAEMGISFPAGGMGHNNVVAGTSYSTPFTCGVIAMMLQRNPYLTFDQVKAKLQSTATPIPGATVAEQGAGVINPELAVLS